MERSQGFGRATSRVSPPRHLATSRLGARDRRLRLGLGSDANGVCLARHLGRGRGLEYAVADAARRAARIRRKEDGVGLRVVADLLEHVEVLRQQQQVDDILRRRALDVAREVRDPKRW